MKTQHRRNGKRHFLTRVWLQLANPVHVKAKQWGSHGAISAQLHGTASGKGKGHVRRKTAPTCEFISEGNKFFFFLPHVPKYLYQ